MTNRFLEKKGMYASLSIRSTPLSAARRSVSMTTSVTPRTHSYRFSEEGIALLKELEGFRGQLYDDTGDCAIGYGVQVHKGKCDSKHPDERPYASGISKTDADRLLRQVVVAFEGVVNAELKIEVSQAQFDALVLFAYNRGPGGFKGSTLLKKLNNGDFKGAEAEFGKHVYAGKVRVEGLVNRRANELNLFTKGTYVKTFSSGPARVLWSDRGGRLRPRAFDDGDAGVVSDTDGGETQQPAIAPDAAVADAAPPPSAAVAPRVKHAVLDIKLDNPSLDSSLLLPELSPAEISALKSKATATGSAEWTSCVTDCRYSLHYPPHASGVVPLTIHFGAAVYPDQVVLDQSRPPRAWLCVPDWMHYDDVARTSSIVDRSWGVGVDRAVLTALLTKLKAVQNGGAGGGITGFTIDAMSSYSAGWHGVNSTLINAAANPSVFPDLSSLKRLVYFDNFYGAAASGKRRAQVNAAATKLRALTNASGATMKLPADVHAFGTTHLALACAEFLSGGTVVVGHYAGNPRGGDGAFEKESPSDNWTKGLFGTRFHRFVPDGGAKYALFEKILRLRAAPDRSALTGLSADLARVLGQKEILQAFELHRGSTGRIGVELADLLSVRAEVDAALKTANADSARAVEHGSFTEQFLGEMLTG